MSTVAIDQDGLVGIKHPLVRDAIAEAMDGRERGAVVADLLRSDLPASAWPPRSSHTEPARDDAVERWVLQAGAAALAAGDAGRAADLYDVAVGSVESTSARPPSTGGLAATWRAATWPRHAPTSWG